MSTMQSMLIVSGNQKLSEDHALKICNDLKINNFDIAVIEKKPKEESKSNLIGIADIRNFQSKIFLKPIKSKNKAIILKNSQDITTEAQNALLKILEEPPPNTIIILAAVNKEAFLPTILSRCKIIEFSEKVDDLPEGEYAQCLTTLISLTALSVHEKLKIAQDRGKNREETLFWLEKMIIVDRREIISKIINTDDSFRFNDLNHFSKSNPLMPQYFNILISLQKTHTIIKTTNASPRLALENLFLSI